MPPRPRPCVTRNLTLLVAFRQALADQRARGAEFGEAWAAALASVVRSAALDSEDRTDWRAALEQTAASWQRAYLGLPAEAREVAVAELLDAVPDRLLADTPPAVFELALDRADGAAVAA